MELEKENKTRKEEGVRGRSDFWKGFVCGAAVLTLFLFLSWFFLGEVSFCWGRRMHSCLLIRWQYPES